MKTLVAVVVSVLFGNFIAVADLSPSMVMRSPLVIANPTGESGAAFGTSIAPMGKDRVIVGAPRSDVGATDAGVVYLHGADGVMLTVITNPVPQVDDRFGFAVAAVGPDYILAGAHQSDVGAVDAGVAYLFSTNGSLVLTLTNPAPVVGDWFGYSVASVGNVMAVSALGKESPSGTNDAGVVYLFATNGVLVTTITNPAPEVGDWFGQVLAPMGSDRLLIGAPQADWFPGYSSGLAYLYATNGQLLTKFYSPEKGDFGARGGDFGAAVCAVGNDFVLIGAPKEGFATASDAGIAYLMTTNGTMVAYFVASHSTNEKLGSAVAAGTDGTLFIAALGGLGAVHVWNTNGVKLTQAGGLGLGFAVAAVGEEQVWATSISAPNTAGRAFLYRVTPSLGLTREQSSAVASWSSYATGYRLEKNTDGVEAGDWVSVTEPVQTTGSIHSVTLPWSKDGNALFRLVKP